jgi:heat shock protein HslJ
MKMLITILTVATLTSTVFGALTYPVVDTAQTESYGSCAGQDAQYKGKPTILQGYPSLSFGSDGKSSFHGW